MRKRTSRSGVVRKRWRKSEFSEDRVLQQRKRRVPHSIYAERGPLEDILEKPDDLSGAIDEQLSVVHRNSLRLLKLVNSLLDFSRIEAGRVDFAVPGLTDIWKVTGEVAKVYSCFTRKAGLAFEVQCDALPESLYRSSRYVEKDRANLLSNAFKYTLQGGAQVRLPAESHWSRS